MGGILLLAHLRAGDRADVDSLEIKEIGIDLCINCVFNTHTCVRGRERLSTVHVLRSLCERCGSDGLSVAAIKSQTLMHVCGSEVVTAIWLGGRY